MKEFRLSRVTAAALLAAVLLAPAQAAAQFLSAAGDVPLAEGLSELDEGGLVFDKPEGRIVQLTALRDEGFAAADIAAFYAGTLPNLGWSAQGDSASSGLPRGLTFTRNGEILRLTFTADLVIFDLTPAPAGPSSSKGPEQ